MRVCAIISFRTRHTSATGGFFGIDLSGYLRDPHIYVSQKRHEKHQNGISCGEIFSESVQVTNEFATGLIRQMFETSPAGDALLVLAEGRNCKVGAGDSYREPMVCYPENTTFGGMVEYTFNLLNV